MCFAKVQTLPSRLISRKVVNKRAVTFQKTTFLSPSSPEDHHITKNKKNLLSGKTNIVTSTSYPSY
jgi:hypothetical protein